MAEMRNINVLHRTLKVERVATSDILRANKGGAANQAPATDGSRIENVMKSNPHLLHVPKNFLLNVVHASGVSNHPAHDSFYVEKKTIGGKGWFTAIFIDPRTNEAFSSGLGQEIHAEKRPSAALKTPLHLAETKVEDGKVWYTQENLAEHAAAARAIDCYAFREGVDLARLCAEEPYKAGDDGVSQEIGHGLLCGVRPATDGDSLSDAITAQCGESLDHGVVLIGGSGMNSSVDEPRESSPDLTSSVAEPTEFARVDNKLTTMGRIAEIWTDTASRGLFNQASPQHDNRTLPKDHEDDSPTAKVQSILDWYERVNNMPQTKAEASALAQLCNKILASLGNANDFECNLNTEDDANTILDKIISLSKDFDDKSDPSFFDADSFNAYMRCLNRMDPVGRAKSAEELLKSMRNREEFRGIVLPLPNAETYNSAINLWSQVEVDGQNGANNIYALFEAASVSSYGEEFPRPNKETFKTMLSVNSKVDGQFSFPDAQDYLSKLEKKATTICGEAFIPDADVFNAALRFPSKSADGYQTDGRYGDSWLGYGCRYVGGFKSADLHSSTEASDIAKWLLYAEERGVNPNAEMYEAVIRAWTKTGSKDGLLMAEAWAKRCALTSEGGIFCHICDFTSNSIAVC